MKRFARSLVLLSVLAGCGGSKQATVPQTALLTGVHARDTGVEFRFRSAPQQVRWGFVAAAKLAESGSGRPIRIDAPLALVVHFLPAATGEPKNGSIELTYSGPARLPGRGQVREVVKVADFEADLAWALGVARRSPVHVSRDGATVTVSVG